MALCFEPETVVIMEMLIYVDLVGAASYECFLLFNLIKN